MPLSQVLLEGKGWELVAEGYKFTEGPAVDAQGQVYFTDIPNNKIHRIDPNGHVHLFAENTARTNGLMFGPDGKLYGCRMGDKQIVAYAPDGTHEVIARDVDSNDLVVTAEGGIYFTDPPNQQVWHLSPTGEKQVVAKGFRPNGVILTADGGTLVVTDSDGPHLWAFRVEKNGQLGSGERYFQPLRLPSGGGRLPGSDGMTVDKAGRVYVATRSGVQMFDPTGRMGGVILKPQAGSLSNVVFGGPELNVLYATCGDKVFRRLTKTQGVRYTDLH
jgi:sugar lactone lactonase YvrE